MNQDFEEPHSEQRLYQGDIFWIKVEKKQTHTELRHPHVIIQEDLFNHSRIETVIVCALTSNLKCANEPGNILLEAGEGNLSRPSVIVVSQIDSVPKIELSEYIGTLSPQRIEQIFAGIRFQQRAFFNRSKP